MINNLTIKQMQSDHRPDEKFLQYGAEALTSSELLAIVLRSGCQGISSLELTRQLLYCAQEDSENILRIFDYDYDDLIKQQGIGTVKALQILAIAELSKRIASARHSYNLNFRDSDTIAAYYMEKLRHRKKEAVVLILLDSSCNFIKDFIISEGTVNVSLFSSREIFIEALKYEAVNIILLHNHPSGSCVPSEADIEGTKRVFMAGKILGISLLDHIIIGDGDFISLSDKGLLNE